MNNNITELVFILDASGSMHSMTEDTMVTAVVVMPNVA